MEDLSPEQKNTIRMQMHQLADLQADMIIDSFKKSYIGMPIACTEEQRLNVINLVLKDTYEVQKNAVLEQGEILARKVTDAGYMKKFKEVLENGRQL